jgi:hypothetical protein
MVRMEMGEKTSVLFLDSGSTRKDRKETEAFSKLARALTENQLSL